ncbi:MAG: hypothetical protein ACRDTA_28435 [Pseudonocardiaceae bacterium]
MVRSGKVRYLGFSNWSAWKASAAVEIQKANGQGNTLYVVQDLFNKVAVVKLDSTYRSGVLAETIANPALDISATIAASDAFLYAVNGRFTTTPELNTSYQIIRLPVN